MKIWLSKYALSDGIKELSCYQPNEGSYYVYHRSGGLTENFVLGKEAHETREAAAEAARVMRDAKIVRLEKQIEKLRTIVF